LVRIEGKGIRMEIHPNGGFTPIAAVQADPVSDPTPAETEPPPADEPVPAEIPIPESAPVSEDDPVPPDEGQGTSEEASDELISPPQEPYSYVSDYRMRVLVVDALRNCEYPAPAHVIGKHCIDTSEQRNVSLPNRRLNQLLTNARRIGLLKEASGEDDETQQFTFVENAQQVKLFLEEEI
jgi:hypothetical protein